ncbi:hypothetical protein CKM354_000036900 [Cercospora kikuchii]|uniref:Zn(2)-C6 fungal-type domain-containing protein n=1 Tax=Cercospora kikuchii TaxID=84275 RepID=A0A9P3F7P9_9PEZI|nr:uncharacterized protein CKM354_000036900 [Cercospora kikuchii]GIZ36903.1 hypothetical protein CKM354_000036900 [Cercospora kikuchii]
MDQPARDDGRDGPHSPNKRKRSFIARNACQACRAKKTKCDEDSPCRQCRTLGIDCIYNESRAFNVILAAIKRIETKIDTGPDVLHRRSVPSETQSDDARTPQRRQEPYASPLSEPQPANTCAESDRVKLSFSAHRIIDFALQTTELDNSFDRLHLESERSILPPCSAVGHNNGTSTWLADLSLSKVKRLCDLYFETFNRIAPILDYESFSRTLGVAVESGFGIKQESCLLLNVLCLGSLAQYAWAEGGFNSVSGSRYREPLPPEPGVEHPSPQENADALRFFDEGRTRIGYLLAEQDLETCQYFLLSATVYAVLLRPLEEWAMIRHACMISASFWSSNHDTSDSYCVDMQRRIFWNALMRETIITDELELPRSPLQDLEGRVSLPKFVPYNDKRADQGSPDEYYHCHYLAQIAVRIIMTRIRDELFYNNPSVYLAEELHHQLEQWRSSLPRSIRADFDSDSSSHEHPSQTVAVAMLQTRYWVSMYHIGRPFLYKAITNPAELTFKDLEICQRSMSAAVAWFAAYRRSLTMRSYTHLIFFVCSQLFGQLLITHHLKSATDDRIRSIAPEVVDDWIREALAFMKTTALCNPTIARDVRVLSKLFSSASL